MSLLLGLLNGVWRVAKTAMATAKTVATNARVLARLGLSPTGEAAVGRTQAPRHRYIAKALGSILRRKNTPSERLLAPTAGPCLNAG